MKDELSCPCGCKMWIENGSFYVIPCSPNCKYFRYVLEESRRQGVPIEYHIKTPKENGNVDV